MKTIIPIILAGGTGSRLWPLSRESFPKQFLELLDNEKYTLLQKTYKRIEDLSNLTKPIIVCNEEHRFIVGDQMREIDIKPLSILLEPSSRNTAPAITIAALKALQEYEDPILLILSSDHEIKDLKKFKKAIVNSISLADEGKLMIFGVVPSYPATGYGYIKSINNLNVNEFNSSKVEKFLEKPDINTARILHKDKNYTWNSGMFVFKAKSIIEEIKSYAPDIFENCQKSLLNSVYDLDFIRINKNNFLNCKNLSIDVAVMEKTKKAFVIPLDCGWDDIGSWESIWKISKKDSYGNVIKGKVLVNQTKNSLIRSEEKLLVTLGLKNTIVIETKDAVLVADKKNSQEVKKIVSILNKEGFLEGKQHKKVYRPWGYYLSIQEEFNFQIKKIHVNPGASLSLQKHCHRSEHWIVIKGIADVEIESNKETLLENESTYIPIGSKHRLSNSGSIPLDLIEVQSGSYLGEDDIIRFEDNYGRT